MAISLLKCRVRLSTLERQVITTPRVADGLAAAAGDLRRDLQTMACMVEGSNRAAIEVMIRQAAAHELRYLQVATTTATAEPQPYSKLLAAANGAASAS
jgi:hypothetical protein